MKRPASVPHHSTEDEVDDQDATLNCKRAPLAHVTSTTTSTRSSVVLFLLIVKRYLLHFFLFGPLHSSPPVSLFFPTAPALLANGTFPRRDAHTSVFKTRALFLDAKVCSLYAGFTLRDAPTRTVDNARSCHPHSRFKEEKNGFASLVLCTARVRLWWFSPCACRLGRHLAARVAACCSSLTA